MISGAIPAISFSSCCILYVQTCTGESSKAIFQTAGVETMEDYWLGFHTFDVEMAIDDLQALYAQKSKNDGQ